MSKIILVCSLIGIKRYFTIADNLCKVKGGMKDTQEHIEKLPEKEPKDVHIMPFIISAEKTIVERKAGKYDKVFARLITYGQMGNNIFI